ncbi:MAG: hypothetical protein JWP68_3671, partial [Modestobacter sp.]|nr:hypothetical protein [Modestobacter sp.]
DTDTDTAPGPASPGAVTEPAGMAVPATRHVAG